MQAFHLAQTDDKAPLVELWLLRYDTFLRKVGCVTQLWRNLARQAMAHHGPSLADPSRRLCMLRLYIFVHLLWVTWVFPPDVTRSGALLLRWIAVSIWSASAVIIPSRFYTYVR